MIRINRQRRRQGLALKALDLIFSRLATETFKRVEQIGRRFGLGCAHRFGFEAIVARLTSAFWGEGFRPRDDARYPRLNL